jgi:hypothetical protein
LHANRRHRRGGAVMLRARSFQPLWGCLHHDPWSLAWASVRDNMVCWLNSGNEPNLQRLLRKPMQGLSDKSLPRSGTARGGCDLRG